MEQVCPTTTSRDCATHGFTFALCCSAFGNDDSQNQPLADWFGIVMGTSHEEPMMRSVPVEWDLFGNGTWDYAGNQAAVYEFWKAGAERARPYEGLITIGMRGNGTLCSLRA